MLNYVPPAHKENYMTLAYASDGIIGGGATFLAGLLLQFLDAHTPMLGGVRVDSYDTLFVICAVVVTTSALAFASLKESGATGVRAFFANFGSGSAIRALLAIPSYGALTSEDRRKELTYGFGGTRSSLVKEELIAALSDPSFDVRHEAIQSLGRLPPGPAVIKALESMLGYDGLEELQYVRARSCEPVPFVRSARSRTRPICPVSARCCATIPRSIAASPPCQRWANMATHRASAISLRSTRTWLVPTTVPRTSRAARSSCWRWPRSSGWKRAFRVSGVSRSAWSAIVCPG